MENDCRLIDAYQFRGKHEVAEVNGKLCSVILYADIVNAPTVDAVEVVHGRWIKRRFTDTLYGYECSICHTTWDAETNCCPNCGAKMDGDGDG